MAIKIFVDQGHNPQNPNAGAEVNGVREQDINYEVGVRLAALLRADPDFDVRLSRDTLEEQLGPSNATPGALIILSACIAIPVPTLPPAAAKPMCIVNPRRLTHWRGGFWKACMI